jgi:hypothetical protein
MATTVWGTRASSWESKLVLGLEGFGGRGRIRRRVRRETGEVVKIRQREGSEAQVGGGAQEGILFEMVYSLCR